MDFHVALRDVDLNIPILTSNQRRLLKKPFFLTSIGGRLGQQKGKVVVHALKNISVEITEGENLALIGHNGAGKTTLLKLIAGIYPPSRGTVDVHGTIGCLFDIGVGISNDLTGYEAIKHQCLINSVPRQEWEELAKEIEEFTDLGDFLSLPIRTYSAGMRARLMAALATAWKHDILLIDEGIGAGDQAFQEKFRERLAGFMARAGMLIVASHSADFLRSYCTKGMVLEHGEVQMVGDLEEALRFYQGDKYELLKRLD